MIPLTATADTRTYLKQVEQTRHTLDTIDDATLVGLTSLGVKGIQALKQEVSEIFPASNLPAFLLQGLIQLEDRILKPERIEADLTVLFRGTRTLGIYSILAAPALVIHGYQRLLSLAGKDVETAFPNGLWQFYTEFGLREDAARHCVETVGFQHLAPRARELDAVTSWVYTAMSLLLTSDDLLANEWEEHRLFRSLRDVLEERARSELGRRPSGRKKAEAYDQAVAERIAEMEDAYQLAGLAQEWAAKRPYAIPPGKPPAKYMAYRSAQFHIFLKKALRRLPPDLREALDRHHQEQQNEKLPAFQEQMSLFTTLHPETYQERRVVVPPHQAYVALLLGGRYYLLDICARNEKGYPVVFPNLTAPDNTGVAMPLSEASDGTLRDCYNHLVKIERGGKVRVDGKCIGRLRPPPIDYVKGQVEAIMKHARAQPAPDGSEPPTDIVLAQAPRGKQEQLRSLLGKGTQQAIDMLRRAPIIINWEQRDGSRSPVDLRRTQRGCGDHAITLIATDRSMIFDLSHISFDGVWGMRFAEVLTNSARAYYALVKESRTVRTPLVEPLTLSNTPAFLKAARSASESNPAEVAVETKAVSLIAITRLRSRLRKIDLPLTVNDILILSRCIHAASYHYGAGGSAAIHALSALEQGKEISSQIETHLEEQRMINPAMLIPMDATGIEPSLRIFPATFRNPLLDVHQRLIHCNQMVKRLKHETDNATLDMLRTERRELYRDLKTFGALMQALREVTMRGESFSIAAMRLLGHLPGPLQHLVNMIPQKIDMLNEIIKGREVFSNVGRVPPGSSLTRFYSSRDDGDTKLLVWGVMSDAQGQLCVTLRDFRPHVKPLVRCGRTDLARALAQDYLDTYAASVNSTVRRIQRIFSYRSEGTL